MHTIMVVAGGLVLLALVAMAGKMTSLGMGRALLWFIPIWLVCAAVNMWVGVSRAGYTVVQEFPIFLLVFAVPAAMAMFLYLRFAR
jgi:hypothetical protein